jgi:Leucine-rich repeat (LRR) protein
LVTTPFFSSQELYIQDNRLVSLSHLESHPRLKVIHAENNQIQTFRGFVVQPQLTEIWLMGNPISRHPRYR